jgi:2-oxoglutarate ferredoxin oxidoreductase subunit gamma
MAKQTEIIMAGTGGQGLIFLASLVADAALRAGLNVVQTQSYGIAQRGGFISSEVVAGAGEILFQQVTSPDLIIVLNEVVGARYDGATAPVLYDSSLLRKEGFANWHGVPFTRIAAELGSARSANLVAIGALAAFLPHIETRFFEDAVAGKNPASAEQGIKAVRAGRAMAEKLTGRG